MKSNTNMAICSCLWGVGESAYECVCGLHMYKRKIVAFVRKWSLSACNFHVWARRTWLSYSSNLMELHNVFPQVCVVCWLSLQYVCWYIGAGDTVRWGTVTPSDRHSRVRPGNVLKANHGPITVVIYGNTTRGYWSFKRYSHTLCFHLSVSDRQIEALHFGICLAFM